MTKIVVISDNHGNKNIMQQVIETERPDLKIHLGDSQMQASEIKMMFDYYVGGNNDVNFQNEELVFEIEGVKIGICHGHTFNFSYFDQSTMVESLLTFAKHHHVKIMMFGHTHVPFFQKINEIILLNPGSIFLPRQSDKKTYATLILNNAKVKKITIKKV